MQPKTKTICGFPFGAMPPHTKNSRDRTTRLFHAMRAFGHYIKCIKMNFLCIEQPQFLKIIISYAAPLPLLIAPLKIFT